MQRITSRTRAFASTTAALILAAAPAALGNSGTQLPLTQYQAGTEQTSSALVTNGDFEQPGSPNPTQPTGWTLTGQMQAGTPINPPTPTSTVGSFAAQGPLGATADPNKYTQTVTLAPDTEYVLSAYIWNFGLGTDLAVAELVDPGSGTNTATLALEPTGSDMGSGADGYFVYRTFNSSQFPGGAVLEVEADLDEMTTGDRPNIWAQIDNVAITPASQFAPPDLIPEPSSLLLTCAAGGLLLRRQRRRA